jgi:hypothetical protein
LRKDNKQHNDNTYTKSILLFICYAEGKNKALRDETGIIELTKVIGDDMTNDITFELRMRRINLTTSS